MPLLGSRNPRYEWVSTGEFAVWGFRDVDRQNKYLRNMTRKEIGRACIQNK